MTSHRTSARPVVVAPTGRSPVEQAADQYLEEARGRLRASTRAIYATAIEGSFLPWLAANEILRPDQLDRRVLSRWVTYLRETHRTPHGKPLSEATIRTYSTSVNFFLTWLARDQGTEPVKAQAPKRRARVIDVLSREEIGRLEAGATTERDKLIIRTLADTGGRLQEVLDLREDDLVSTGRREYAVRLEGKSGARLCPITPGLHKRLRSYVDHGRPRDYTGTRIFVGLHTVLDGRYKVPGRTTVARMIREAGERAGLKKRVHAHLLRHSAITNQLRRGMNPLLVAQVAGHSSLEMIRSTYAHMTVGDAHKAMMQALADDDDD